MFAHLHCHFYGSYSDSILDPERIPEYLEALGQRSIALTDHGVIDYALPFYRICRAAGIHPVIGCEVYFVDDARRSIERGDTYRTHLVLLAADNQGLANLVRLVNESWLENSFEEARGLVDWRLLEKYHQGLIALSACFWGSLPQKYITGGLAAAEKEFERYYEIFGRDFFPELARHGIVEEEQANEGLIALSRRFGVTPVVTNDCHYQRPEDWKFHDVLIKTRFGYATDFSLDSRQYYLKSEQEMLGLGFPPEYCRISEEIADRCRVDLDSLPVDLQAASPPEAQEAVFASRLIVIDGPRALRDAAAVFQVGGKKLDDLLDRLPEGISLAEARRESSFLGQWLDRHPGPAAAAAKLEGVPRRIAPDWETVIPVPLDRLRGWLPLRRAGGAVIASAPREVLADLGVPRQPPSALFDQVSGLEIRLKELSVLEKAREKMAVGDHTAAAVLLEGILQAAPERFDVRILLADTYYSRKSYRKALEQYRILTSGELPDRQRGWTLVRQGWSSNWLGDPEGALAAFARAREHDPDFAPALYGLGMVCNRQDRTREAREYLQAFLRLRGEGRQAEKARGVLARLGG